MDITFTLNELEQRALLVAMARENAQNGTSLTPDQYVEARIKDQPALLVRNYKERIANDFFSRFEKASLAKQQQVLAVLNDELPSDRARQ